MHSTQQLQYDLLNHNNILLLEKEQYIVEYQTLVNHYNESVQSNEDALQQIQTLQASKDIQYTEQCKYINELKNKNIMLLKEIAKQNSNTVKYKQSIDDSHHQNIMLLKEIAKQNSNIVRYRQSIGILRDQNIILLNKIYMSSDNECNKLIYRSNQINCLNKKIFNIKIFDKYNNKKLCD